MSLIRVILTKFQGINSTKPPTYSPPYINSDGLSKSIDKHTAYSEIVDIYDKFYKRGVSSKTLSTIYMNKVGIRPDNMPSFKSLEKTFEKILGLDKLAISRKGTNYVPLVTSCSDDQYLNLFLSEKNESKYTNEPRYLTDKYGQATLFNGIVTSFDEFNGPQGLEGFF